MPSCDQTMTTQSVTRSYTASRMSGRCNFLNATWYDWVKVFERYWAHQVDQIKQRAERKALERMVRLDDDANKKKED
jgi:hypothetical protein